MNPIDTKTALHSKVSRAPRFSRRSTLPLAIMALSLNLASAPALASNTPVSDIKYSEPIIIKKGGTYSGNWESNSNVPAVYIQTTEPVTIENANIRGRGNLIAGFGGRLTIRNVHGYNLNPNRAGKAAGRAINMEEFYKVIVTDSYFEGGNGIYLRKYVGEANQQETIKILRNQFKNIDGRLSDGNNGYTDKYDLVHAILLNGVQRVPNVEIAWNEIINEPGKSLTEENINLFVSSGTPQSPIRIHNNYIQGAYPVNYLATQFAGGGILVGDGKVTDPLDSGYTRVYDNQIVGTTNVGLAIVGGVDNQMYNNRVIGSGLISASQRLASTNVGLYVWDRLNAAEQSPPTFARNRMESNVVGWTKVGPDGTITNNPVWFPACGVQGTVCGGNERLGTITLGMEQAEYARWKAKLTAANIKLGPNS